MTWGEAFGKSLYYLVAHIVLGFMVFALVGIGSVITAQTALGGGETSIAGILLILAGLVIAIVGGPAILIKVIGDVLGDLLHREDNLHQLALRLRNEKEERFGWSYRQGSEDGRFWAIEDATYDEMEQLSDSEHAASIPPNERPFPESAEDWLSDAEDIAKEQGEQFNRGDYARGFLAAVARVWTQVASQV